MILLGIAGIKDPVRPAVPASVAQCKSAGILVRMLTGDNLETARFIARECGILMDGGVAKTGPEIRAMNDDELDSCLPSLQVLARCSPADKLRVVDRLRKLGEVVAVTGDGSNDAPALTAADIGFAMGVAGTDIAKEASDIVLLDDNFVSIVKAVMWGRNVYDSIRKFLQFQLTVNVVAIAIAVSSAALIGYSPLQAVQLLWVNLIMDTFAALALATEEPTEELLKRKPYGRNDNLISPTMWRNILGTAAYQFIILMVLLFKGASLFDIPEHVAGSSRSILFTFIFNTFVFMQVFNEINSRRCYNELNVFEGFFNNSLFVFIIVGTAIAQFFIVQFGGSITATVALDARLWGWSVLIGLSIIPMGIVLRMFKMSTKTKSDVYKISTQ
ncbi:hypothetical protein RCL1_009082 [Eukaryota sp. TZLM3-RCL]